MYNYLQFWCCCCLWKCMNINTTQTWKKLHNILSQCCSKFFLIRLLKVHKSAVPFLCYTATFKIQETRWVTTHMLTKCYKTFGKKALVTVIRNYHLSYSMDLLQLSLWKFRTKQLFVHTCCLTEWPTIQYVSFIPFFHFVKTRLTQCI
jgi:hypothetical protein